MKTTVIGAGFAGLSAASCLAKKGYQVTLLEKHNQAGGRARSFTDSGFFFDMGPSWYWMPEVFEKFYHLFNHTVSDFYELIRLNPSYTVFFDENHIMQVPASMEDLENLFEQYEKGAALKLRKFLHEAAYKYDVGINKLVYKPGKSMGEFADSSLLYGLFKMDVFTSISKHVRQYFKNPYLIKLLEFPVLFLGAKPSKTPALYSLMNYADMSLGTWYPIGGMHQIAKAFEKIALEQGVHIKYNSSVLGVDIENKKIKNVLTATNSYSSDIVVAGADYHFIETKLLPKTHQSYSSQYWDSRVLAPSSLIFYLGINKRLENLTHHNLFFDEDFTKHAEEIYDSPAWPQKPLFYVSCPSKSDASVAPEGMENIFILIPVAPNLNDTDEIKEHYYQLVIQRLEKLTKQSIANHVIVKRAYAHSNFINDYNAFKGNAYGLANTLSQTALLKPRMKSKKLTNLYYTGQLTVPGPGVPPSIISGQVVSNEISKEFKI